MRPQMDCGQRPDCAEMTACTQTVLKSWRMELNAEVKSTNTIFTVDASFSKNTGFQPDPQQEGRVTCFRTSQNYSMSVDVIPLWDRDKNGRSIWGRHLRRASSLRWRWRLRICSTQQGSVRTCSFPKVSTTEGGVEFPGVLHRSPWSSCPLCVISRLWWHCWCNSLYQYSHGLIGEPAVQTNSSQEFSCGTAWPPVAQFSSGSYWMPWILWAV